MHVFSCGDFLILDGSTRPSLDFNFRGRDGDKAINTNFPLSQLELATKIYTHASCTSRTQPTNLLAQANSNNGLHTRNLITLDIANNTGLSKQQSRRNSLPTRARSLRRVCALTRQSEQRTSLSIDPLPLRLYLCTLFPPQPKPQPTFPLS